MVTTYVSFFDVNTANQITLYNMDKNPKKHVVFSKQNINI